MDDRIKSFHDIIIQTQLSHYYFHKMILKIPYPVAVVADFNDEVILAEVPDSSAAAGTGRGQDVLHLTVPRHAADVLQRLGSSSEHRTG